MKIPWIRQTRSLFALWFCLFSLIDLPSTLGLVVCIGQDGHIALETSRDGDSCLPPSAAAALADADISAENDHCGGCRDIGFSLPSLHSALAGRASSPSRAAVPVIPVFPFFLPWAFPGFKAPAPRAFPSPPALADLTLPSIRATVLLI